MALMKYRMSRPRRGHWFGLMVSRTSYFSFGTFLFGACLVLTMSTSMHGGNFLRENDAPRVSDLGTGEPAMVDVQNAVESEFMDVSDLPRSTVAEGDSPQKVADEGEGISLVGDTVRVEDTQPETQSQSMSSLESELLALDEKEKKYWDANCGTCEPIDCYEDLSYDKLLKGQGQVDYECQGSFRVLCCERISDATREKIRKLAISYYSPWLESGIEGADVDEAYKLVQGNAYSSFFVQVKDQKMSVWMPSESIHYHHDMKTCSSNRNDMLDGRRLYHSKKATDGEGVHFQDRPGNRMRMKNFLQLLQHYIDVSGTSARNMELAAASGDGPGPYSSFFKGRPFPSFGVLPSVLDPTLPFPKQDNERDPDISVWDRARRSWFECPQAQWESKLAKVCFRGAIRHSTFCNGYTETGVADVSGKVNAANWKDVARTRMLWLRQEQPNLYDVNFSDLDRRAEEIGIPNWNTMAVDTPSRMTMQEQASKFKYLVNIEGNRGWADRTRYLLLSNSTTILQHSPSYEWFERLFKPEEHFLQTDGNLRNLTEIVRWAQENDEKSQKIAEAAGELGREVLSIEGQTLFASLMFELYGRLSDSKISEERKMVPIECMESGECLFGGDKETFAAAY